MPIFEYNCLKCKTKFEIFHKDREVEEDIICPSCGSANAKRLMSIPSIGSSIKSSNSPQGASCEYANTQACRGNCDMFK